MTRKLLYVLHYPVFGGPHNQALRLNQHLSKRSWQTTVLLPDEPGNAAERLRAGGVEVIQMPLHRMRATPDPCIQLRFALSLVPEMTRIRHLIRERRIDLVLIGGLVNPHGAIAARLEKVPVVWQLLDSRAPAALRWMLMPVVLRLADAVMSTGTEIARLHPGALSLGDRLISFVPPVDVDAFHPDSHQRLLARERLGLGSDDVVIGNVSNINPQKGHRTFIQAAALLRRTHPQVRFVILGATYVNHARYADELWRQAEALGLHIGRDLFVRDPGSEVADLAAAIDVFWLTSERSSEGIPTVIEEAMALGIPVVTVDVGAVREVVDNGVTGYVVEAGSAKEITRATDRLLGNSRIRAAMKEQSRRRAVQNFNPEVCSDVHIRAFDVATTHHRLRDVPGLLKYPSWSASRDFASDLFVCPACRSSLVAAQHELCCEACSRTYRVEDGIPILLVDEHSAEHDEIEHTHAKSQKDGQAAFFDRERAAEFEITRPHGSPSLYQWLLSEKFRRSLAGVESLLAGARVLTVCGGSGMDAEFLARAGAKDVISSDISIGASRRARERARRYGLPIIPIVADVEHLPFRDRSIEVVYVHDGLHHLENPGTGLAEMARVATGVISVTEPSRAAVTALAVRLGLALEREEAGNRVARVRRSDASHVLGLSGFGQVHASRYAMYYPHEPGRAFQILSRGPVFTATKLGFGLLNRFVGRFGNKLTIQAVRQSVMATAPRPQM